MLVSVSGGNSTLSTVLKSGLSIDTSKCIVLLSSPTISSFLSSFTAVGDSTLLSRAVSFFAEDCFTFLAELFLAELLWTMCLRADVGSWQESVEDEMLFALIFRYILGMSSPSGPTR